MQQQVTVAGMFEKHTGKLPGQLELVVGMKAMVTMNIATEADLANGMRGEIINIVLDPRELNPHRDEETSVTRLQYLPAMILFKPYHYTFGRLEGLPDGVIPIFPSEIKFNIPHQGWTIRCLPAITAGYAFTDYKSQGQTIECVIVDLGKPPWGALMAFNAYVTLSQSCG
jgi:ATP-dependent exoDNAse (exonuclease V) alpha subunit